MPTNVEQPPLMQAYLDYLNQLPQGAPKLSFIDYASALNEMGDADNPLWRTARSVCIAASVEKSMKRIRKES